MTEIASARTDFDIPDDVAYLNCAYMGPLPRSVAEVGTQAWLRKSTPWHVGTDDFFADIERLRAALSALTGLDADGFAIVNSVSYGAAVAAANLEVVAGQNIVVASEQFPSNVYAWRELARLTGARLRTAERDAAGDPTPGLIAAIDGDTAVVALAPCHWTDGARVDLGAVDGARPEGCRLVLDTAQSLGAVDLELPSLRPDVVLGAMYKWLLGPYTVGFAWLSEDLRDGTPLEHNWIGRAESENFAGLVDYRDDFRPGARRYDMGEVSNFALIPAAVRAVEMITDWKPGHIARHAQAITEQIADGAASLGYRPTPAPIRSDHLLGIELPDGVDPGAVAAQLSTRGVYVSVRGRSVRVSAHVFNDDNDADRLVGAMRDLLA